MSMITLNLFSDQAITIGGCYAPSGLLQPLGVSAGANEMSLSKAADHHGTEDGHVTQTAQAVGASGTVSSYM